MEWGFQWQGEYHVDRVSPAGHDGTRDWPVIGWVGNAGRQGSLEIVKGLASRMDHQIVWRIAGVAAGVALYPAIRI